MKQLFFLESFTENQHTLSLKHGLCSSQAFASSQNKKTLLPSLPLLPLAGMVNTLTSATDNLTSTYKVNLNCLDSTAFSLNLKFFLN